MRLAVPDLISNSYFPAIAACELGFAEAEGLALSHELIFPVTKTMQALRDGELDFVAGSAHSTLTAFPEWQGAKIVVALAQGMYWMLVLRADLEVERGDIEAIKGLRIGAAPGVDLGLRGLLLEAGIDPSATRSRSAPYRARLSRVCLLASPLRRHWKQASSMGFGLTLWVQKSRCGAASVK